MRDVVTNLLASVLAGTAVVVFQALARYRRTARTRAFFGLDAGATCVLTVARHAASPHGLSVHRRDAAALVELGTVVRGLGAVPELIVEPDASPGAGRYTEMCVGGPDMNPRTAAHLRAVLRGVGYAPPDTDADGLALSVGTATFRREPGRVEYGLLARIWGPAGGRPVFVLSGQTARANLATARFLATHHRQLMRRYGRGRRFCLVLRVLEPATFGADFVEVAQDVTGSAFDPPGQAA